MGVDLYKGFYSLKENPFRLSPDPAFMCMTPQHQEALAGLVYTVCTRPGLTVLLGEAGTGKTTLLYSLLGLLEKRRFCTAMCTNPTLTRQEFYDLLMVKFGIGCQSVLKSRQLAALEETLRRNRMDGRPSVLIVDEAQRLSAELLEEVRLLLNLETPREKLLEIIMSGQPELGEMLRRPELRQLKQRVSSVCRLQPLSLEEVVKYINERLARAGLPKQTIFSGPVIEMIFEYTGGVPRVINTLCDSALRTGFALQAPRITAPIIEEAAKDLELASSFDVRESRADGAAAHFNPPAAPQPHEPAPAEAGESRNGHAEIEDQVPLEAYANRQKGFSFFSNLMDRWK